MNKPLLHAVLNYLVKGSSDFLLPGSWFARPEELVLIDQGLFTLTDLKMNEIRCPVCGAEDTSIETSGDGSHYVVCAQTGEIVELSARQAVYLKFVPAVFDRLLAEDPAFRAQAEFARFLQIGRMGRHERPSGADRRSPSSRRTLNRLLERYLAAESRDTRFNLKGSAESLIRQLRQSGTDAGFKDADQLRQAFNYDLIHFYDLDAERAKRLMR